MKLIITQYGFLIVYIIFSFLLSSIIFILSYSIATNKPNAEKLSAYECGFDPFEDARSQFDVRFYLVAILFLIFDLEASFLFPWSITIQHLGANGFWVIIDFFIELVVGFFYVWKTGALEWE